MVSTRQSAMVGQFVGLDVAMFMGWMHSTSPTAIPPANRPLSPEIIFIRGGMVLALLAAKQALATTATSA